MDGLALLSISKKGDIKKGEFDNLVSRNLFAPTKIGQVKAQVFPFVNK